MLRQPMLLSEDKRHILGREGWIYELKFDGYRLLAGMQDGEVQLGTRNGANATKWFPEITAGLARIPGGPHVMDGEVCVLDDLGRSDFNKLQDRALRRRWYEGADPVVFCCFDLLERDGRCMTALPIQERKAQLQEMLTPAPPPSVMFVGHFDAQHARELFAIAEELKLEGLVAKKLGSHYLPGKRTTAWEKVKRKGAVPPERFKR